MDNENNRWEYDYSSGNTSSGDTGYLNVGSSGTNAANTYNDTPYRAVQATPVEPDFGGTPPPVQPGPAAPESGGKKRRRFSAARAARSVLALVLVAAVGFAGGVAGARLTGGPRVVWQTADPATASSTVQAVSTSTGGKDLTLPQVSALVSPSVVVITTEQVVYSQWSWYGQSQVLSGAGSGVILSSDGYILTCAHVVDGASNVKVTIDDQDYTATVVGADSTSDVAVIKIEAEGLTPATVGNSDTLMVGESVIAVGNPLGELGGTVTNGIVSAVNRSVSVESDNDVNTMSLIQTNASISPGNSGGGLFNMAGELIGVVNVKYADTDVEGLGFAIPINDAVKVAQDLIENGYVSGRPYMGLSYLNVTDASTAQQLGVSAYGIYVAQVVSGGPADKAGVQVGDRIISIDGAEIAAKGDLTSALQKYSAGDTIQLTVARKGQIVELSLTLGEWNASNMEQRQKN